MAWRKILVFITALLFLGVFILFKLVASQKGPQSIDVTCPLFGDPKAPVELVIFEDFKCYACRLFSKDVLPHILSDYVDTKKVRLKVVPLAFLNGSKPLANAAIEVCQLSSDHFFDYAKKLFAHFEFTEVDESTETVLLELAKEVGGIDLKQLKLCIETKCHYKELDQNLAKAKALMGKALRIPALFINGVRINALDYEEIQEEIRRAAQ